MTRARRTAAATPEQQRLAAANTGLAWGQAFAQHRSSGGALDLDELASEALVALTRAAINYDPNYGTKFSTFAVVSIKRQLWRYVKEVVATRKQATSFDVTRQDTGRPDANGWLQDTSPDIDRIAVD